MNDDDIKRNIIVSVVGLVLILALLIFEIFSFGSAINNYHKSHHDGFYNNYSNCSLNWIS